MSRRRAASSPPPWHVRGQRGRGSEVVQWAAPRILLTGYILPSFHLSLRRNVVTVTSSLSFLLHSTADFYILSSIAHLNSNQSSFFYFKTSLASSRMTKRSMLIVIYFPLFFSALNVDLFSSHNILLVESFLIHRTSSKTHQKRELNFFYAKVKRCQDQAAVHFICSI